MPENFLYLLLSYCCWSRSVLVTSEMERSGDLVGGRRVQGSRAERERGEEKVVLLVGGRARVTV